MSAEEKWEGAESRGWDYPQRRFIQNKGTITTSLMSLWMQQKKNAVLKKKSLNSAVCSFLRFVSVPHPHDGTKPFIIWFVTPEMRHSQWRWDSRTAAAFIISHWYYKRQSEECLYIYMFVSSSPTAGARPLGPTHFLSERCCLSRTWCWTAGSIWMEHCQKARSYWGLRSRCWQHILLIFFTLPI